MKKETKKTKAEKVEINDAIILNDNETNINNIIDKNYIIKDINEQISNLTKTKSIMFNDIFKDFRNDFKLFSEKLKKENSLLTKKQIYTIYGVKLDGLKLNSNVLSIYKSLVVYYTQNNINIDFNLFDNNSSLFVKLMDIYNLCFNIKEVHKLENKKIVKYSFDILEINNIFNINEFSNISKIEEMKKFINNINDIIKTKFNQFKKEIDKNDIIATYEKAKNGLDKKTKRVKRVKRENLPTIKKENLELV